MKKVISKIVCIVFLVIFSQCNEIKEILQIKGIIIPTEIDNVDIPFAGIKNMKIARIEVNLNFDVSEEIKKIEPRADINKVKEAKLNAFTVEKLNSSFIGDLKVFKDVEIWVSAPGFEETKVAWIKGNTEGEKMQLEVDENIELINFLKAKEGKKIILKNILIGSTTLTEFTLKLKPTWKITVGLL